MQSGRKREIGEGANIVVGKIDGILVLERQSQVNIMRLKLVTGCASPLQHLDFQLPVSCDLQSANHDINGARLKV